MSYADITTFHQQRGFVMRHRLPVMHSIENEADSDRYDLQFDKYTVILNSDGHEDFAGNGPQNEVFAEATAARKQAAEAQTRLAAIVESCEDAIISKDVNGIITSWNASAERIFGFTAEEAIGRPIYIIVPPELKTEEDEILSRLRRGERIQHHETARLRKDRSPVAVSLTISPLRDPYGKIVGASKIARDITERKEAENARKNRDLAVHVLQIQDEERRRIARELHDSVGQLLAAISMDAALLERENDNLSNTSAQRLKNISQIAEQASKEIRTISYLLHPPALEELGLRSAVTSYVQGFVARSKIAVDLQIAEQFPRLPYEHELCLFRVIQECLTNIHGHSGSLTAAVRLYRTDRILLEVTDHGKGITAEHLQGIARGQTGGVGLRGMRERIRQLGGSFEVRSSSNGTSVTITLPI